MIIYTSHIPAKNDPCNIQERESVFLFPDLRMFDRYDNLLKDLIKKYSGPEGNMETLEIARRNFLKRAVLLFYQAGHTDKALSIYNTLRKDYPKDKDVQVPLAEYARNRLINELKSIGLEDATQIITLMLEEGYYHYALYDDDEAYGREKMAKEVYDYYQKRYGDEGVDRITLPDFNILRYVGLSSFMNDLRYPDDLKQNLLDRLRVEKPEFYEQMKAQHEAIMKEMEKEENKQQQEQSTQGQEGIQK